MGHGITKKKIIVILVCVFIVLLIIGFIAYWLYHEEGESVSFDANDADYFRRFFAYYGDDEYQFSSLDAYYLNDSGLPGAGTYYYRGVYSFYFDLDGKWYDIDEVFYGRYGSFSNSYCLSWDSIEGFEEVNKEFQRAQKEGVHKSYSAKDIERLIKEAKERAEEEE